MCKETKKKVVETLRGIIDGPEQLAVVHRDMVLVLISLIERKLETQWLGSPTYGTLGRLWHFYGSGGYGKSCVRMPKDLLRFVVQELEGWQ